MTLEELHKAMEADEDMEYHITGRETNIDRTGIVPGWYPCTVYEIKPNGNVEIGVKTPNFIALEVTVLKRNISIAFRRKQAEAQKQALFICTNKQVGAQFPQEEQTQ